MIDIYTKIFFSFCLLFSQKEYTMTEKLNSKTVGYIFDAQLFYFVFQSGKYKSGGDGVNGYQEGVNQASHVVKQLDMVILELEITIILIFMLKICSCTIHIFTCLQKKSIFRYFPQQVHHNIILDYFFQHNFLHSYLILKIKQDP